MLSLCSRSVLAVLMRLSPAAAWPRKARCRPSARGRRGDGEGNGGVPTLSPSTTSPSHAWPGIRAKGFATVPPLCAPWISRSGGIRRERPSYQASGRRDRLLEGRARGRPSATEPISAIPDQGPSSCSTSPTVGAHRVDALAEHQQHPAVGPSGEHLFVNLEAAVTARAGVYVFGRSL